MCTDLVIATEGRWAEAIFGYPDHLKFHSSMTLFSRAGVDNGLFQTALDKFFGGQVDPLTIEQLAES